MAATVFNALAKAWHASTVQSGPNEMRNDPLAKAGLYPIEVNNRLSFFLALLEQADPLETHQPWSASIRVATSEGKFGIDTFKTEGSMAHPES